MRQSCSVQLTRLAVSSCWSCLCLPWAGLPCLASEQCRVKDNLTLRKMRGQGNTKALSTAGSHETWLLLRLFVPAASPGLQLCLDLMQLWLVHLYVCVCMPCVYVCVYPSVYAYVCVCMYACVCMYVCTRVCTPVCVCMPVVCTCVYPSVYARVCVPERVRPCVCIPKCVRPCAFVSLCSVHVGFFFFFLKQGLSLAWTSLIRLV